MDSQREQEREQELAYQRCKGLLRVIAREFGAARVDNRGEFVVTHDGRIPELRGCEFSVPILYRWILDDDIQSVMDACYMRLRG